MKKLIIFLFAILVAFPAFCETVTLTFEWDPNTEINLAGYRLYQSDKSGEYTKGAHIAEVGKVATCQDTIQIFPGEAVYYVLTAFLSSGQESAFSNEVTFFLPAIPPDEVAPPNFRLKSWAVAF